VVSQRVGRFGGVLVDKIVSVIAPTACPVCREPGPAPCDRCWGRLDAAPALAPPRHVDRIRALLRYEGAGRELIARTKYANARASIPWLADGLAALVSGGGDSWRNLTVVTWAPTTRRRRRRRGYDQAEVLARATARRLGLAPARLLERRDGSAQTGRSRSDREDDPPVFTARRPTRIAGSRVLLVDDVVTTGATLTAAAAALKLAGATAVNVVTAAATPLKVWPDSADA